MYLPLENNYSGDKLEVEVEKELGAKDFPDSVTEVKKKR